jgi:hypothetical protein
MEIQGNTFSATINSGIAYTQAFQTFKQSFQAQVQSKQMRSDFLILENIPSAIIAPRRHEMHMVDFFNARFLENISKWFCGKINSQSFSLL